MKKIGWNFKTKFKYVTRNLFYSGLFQSFLCHLIASYLKFVMLTSRKTFNNLKYVDNMMDEGKSFIVVSWHNRITLSAFTFLGSSKLNKKYKFHALASKHGDGAIVGKVMQNCGINIISGSTKKKYKTKSSIRDLTNKGIDISNFRKIFQILKGNNAFCVTPDGPRGPRFKVGGEIISIAKSSQVPIIPISYGISRYKVFKSWDRFILPLPFSKIAFLLGDPIFVPKNSDIKELEAINKRVEEGINFVCRKSDKIVGANPNLD